MRTSAIAGLTAAAGITLLAGLATAAPASAGSTSITGSPVCAQGIAPDQDGNYLITWTGQTSDVPAHDVGTVHVDGLFVDGQPAGLFPTIPPVAPNASYSIRQIRVPGWATSAGITGHVDWSPAIDPATGQPYPDGDTATAAFTGQLTLDGSCTVHPVTAPVFIEQASCDAPGQYRIRPYSRVVYTVNGRSDSTSTASVHQLPLNYPGTVTVAAFDNHSGAPLGSWSHAYATTAVSRCVNPATVHYTATVACGQVTVHASVDPAGVPTVLDVTDLVYGLPLAYGQFSVQPGATASYVYRLTPASRPAGPDTVIVSIYTQHTGDGHPLTLSVPHLCKTTPAPARQQLGTPLAAHRSVLAAAHPVTASGPATAVPALAVTGASPLLALGLAALLMSGGAALIVASRRA